MSIIVQKYGGSSVADVTKIKKVAKRIAKTHKSGNQVVAVVSAMGKTTDELINLAYEITDSPSPREMDMLMSTGEQISVALLAIAIEAMGSDAISFNAHQVGFYTDSAFTKAKIKQISTERITKALETGKIVIIAGFQGIDEELNITTLGRGGSDTSAVALAAVLDAGICEIYTDVDGVYTTDPRIVPEARKIDTISYDEMLELASLGAGVLHGRSVELAKKYDMPIHVRSSFNNDPGTIVTKEVKEMEKILVSGAAVNKDEAKLTVRNVPDKPGIAYKVFGAIARANIVVDMIIQNVSVEGRTDISFTVSKSDLREAMKVLENLKKELELGDVIPNENIAKLSIVGVGMRSHSGVAETMFKALADINVNIDMISTSEIKISCVIEEDRADEALRAVHSAFELDKMEM